MKKIFFLLALAATMLSVTSCKTTEANYRAAYEQARQHRDGRSSAIDETVYEAMRRESRPATMVVGTDTVPFNRARVALHEPRPGEVLQPAYVVVAQFKQIFNARSMRDNLRANGWPQATLLVTGEPLFYVAVEGAADLPSAVPTLRRVQGDSSIHPRDPYPLVLLPVK